MRVIALSPVEAQLAHVATQLRQQALQQAQGQWADLVAPILTQHCQPGEFDSAFIKATPEGYVLEIRTPDTASA